jgi:hypothetical protein
MSQSSFFFIVFSSVDLIIAATRFVWRQLVLRAPHSLRVGGPRRRRQSIVNDYLRFHQDAQQMIPSQETLGVHPAL